MIEQTPTPPYVDEDACAACGFCYNTYGDSFGPRPDGIAYIKTNYTPSDLIAAAEDCPSKAIILK